MNSESDRSRLRDPDVLANRFGASRPSEPLRLPPIRFDIETRRGFDAGATLRCITPGHIVLFALVLAMLALIERFVHPIHVM